MEMQSYKQWAPNNLTVWQAPVRSPSTTSSGQTLGLGEWNAFAVEFQVELQ